MWPFRKPAATLVILCSANVCRSPAAAALLAAALRRRGLGRRVRVLSAGTEVGAPGAPADPRMRALAREAGVAMGRSGARALTPALLASATVVYAMEPAHLDAVEALLAENNHYVDGECTLLDPDGAAVDDPYFGDKAGVRAVFERLLVLADARAAEWQQRLAAAGDGRMDESD